MVRQDMRKQGREGGFLKLIVLFVIFAGLMVYFSIDLRGFIDSHPGFFEFFHSVGEFAVHIWLAYILPFIQWIGDRISFE